MPTDNTPSREEMIQEIGDVIGNHSVIYEDIIDYISKKDDDLLEYSKEILKASVSYMRKKKENTLKIQSDECIACVYSLLQ